MFLNGTREKGLGCSDFTPGGCRVVRLAEEDHVDIDACQASGATVTVAPNNLWNWLTVRMLQARCELTANHTWLAVGFARRAMTGRADGDLRERVAVVGLAVAAIAPKLALLLHGSCLPTWYVARGIVPP